MKKETTAKTTKTAKETKTTTKLAKTTKAAKAEPKKETKPMSTKAPTKKATKAKAEPVAEPVVENTPQEEPHIPKIVRSNMDFLLSYGIDHKAYIEINPRQHWEVRNTLPDKVVLQYKKVMIELEPGDYLKYFVEVAQK